MTGVRDNELLEQFQESESDEVFALIVERYVHLVHSVALRHTANVHHAEEITQAVFIVLARRADTLDRKTVLSGWLYHAARLTAANYRRSEQRRFKREQEALMQSSLEQADSGSLWHEVSPLIDGAMARLRPADRDALVLRFFENKSLPEVGEALGVGERAAQKRVARALDKLRRFFVTGGVSASVGALSFELSSYSVQAAPLGLAIKITAAAKTGSAVAGSTLTLAKGTIKIMSWLKMKTAVVLGSATVLAVGAGVAVTHHNRAQAEQSRAVELENKLEAERRGGAMNVSQDPNAQKLEAERKEMELKASRQREGSPKPQ